MKRLGLPVEEVLAPLRAAVDREGAAVLVAPPGAGKTTLVPLDLARARPDAKVLLMEPRRLAARAAAERMAELLHEPVGQTVGYRMRGEARVSERTRIEVITEGILTRMIQRDPALDGVGLVIFDEFHERSLNADLGLALALEARATLRDDLAIVVMSATLDAAPVAALLGGAPTIASEGRAFPVETHWLDRPLGREARLEEAVAARVLEALGGTEGDMLVFLPGEPEIRRVASRLAGRVPDGVHVRPLFGAMDLAAQRAAIAPPPSGRKIVLATSVAETSLTIPGVRVVVDSGLARRARFDPGSGMSRLVTERVSRAEAAQRRGRAGRTAPGWCFRLWTRAEEGGLPAHPPAEIEIADVTALALEVAVWGTPIEELALLSPPPPGPWAEAQALLRSLGAVDAEGRVTEHGRAMAALPVHPRLAHMLLSAGPAGATLAALSTERDPLLPGAPVDISLRLAAVENPKAFAAEHPWPVNRARLERIRAEARRLAAAVRDGPSERGPGGDDAPPSAGALAALAWPDRIGLRRPGDQPRWLLSGGKGATMDPADPMAGDRLVVAVDLDGQTREARIRQAAAISEAELRELFADRIRFRRRAEWSRRARRIEAVEEETLGRIVLARRRWQDCPPEARIAAALDGVRDLGLDQLGWTPAARRFLARLRFLSARPGLPEGALPRASDEDLMAALDAWLGPFLGGVQTAQDIRALDPLPALEAWVGWEGRQLLDRLAPPSYVLPTGRRVPVDYGGDAPGIEARVQELFGVTTHPVVGPDALPLRITLLSPAGRPVQTTTDLPAFWRSSYADVRKDMRGRYPKHHWPEDPAAAAPARRTRPRGH
ncbi:MAG: ATP-dependent helicase HrpB [Alphaproteobacteria bacterium]|nr:MAG: ATP-dependent helicase HrpB [Alphaproteobacteria bacterium]